MSDFRLGLASLGRTGWQPLSATMMIALWLLVLLIMAGCSGSDSALGPLERTRILTELDRHEALWLSHDIDAYRFAFRRDCTCAPETTVPVAIEVQGGFVQRVRLLSTGETIPISSAYWPTVAQLFDEVRMALDEHATAIEVQYDPVFGHPTRLSIAYSSDVAAANTVTYFAGELEQLP